MTTTTPQPDAPLPAGPLRLPPAKIKQLQNLGVFTGRDLLYHLPRHHEDRSRFTPSRYARHRERQTFRGVISDVRRHPKKPHAQVATLTDPDDGPPIDLMWFGQRHLIGQVVGGSAVQVHGAVFRPGPQNITVTQPELDFPEQREPVNTGRVVPVYPLTKSMTQDYLRRAILTALARYAPALERSRPGAEPQSLARLLRQAHFPDTVAQAQDARDRLAEDEILELQIALIMRRRDRQARNARQGLNFDPAPRRDFLSRLPFQPTAAQLRCIEEIAHDLAQDGPAMNRLLQGEVGSGKTIVALAAAIDAAAAGAQTTLLTPTEILAEQHFDTACRVLNATPGPDAHHVAQARLQGLDHPISIGLLTASASARQRRTILGQAQLGIIDLLIGTHSIIQPQVRMPNHALSIVDEQHRFGVRQRSDFRGGSHYLMLTATPIPRTMQITLYRDLDVSTIDETPPGRAPVQTVPLAESQREVAYQSMRDAAAQGHQAIIVCPLIDEGEDTGVQAVNGMRQRLRQDVFPDLNVAVVHGRTPTKQREAALSQFHRGEAQILLTTAVVEAGFDVPNATVMLIESSERFGMAQLHQLRGRVGRGPQPGLCYLMISPGHTPSSDTRHRIRTVRDCQDGLQLAAADLSLRGHGELYGLRQSGREQVLKTGSHYDAETLQRQHDVANRITTDDPDLSQPEHRRLRQGAERITARFGDAGADH